MWRELISVATAGVFARVAWSHAPDFWTWALWFWTFALVVALVRFALRLRHRRRAAEAAALAAPPRPFEETHADEIRLVMESVREFQRDPRSSAKAARMRALVDAHYASWLMHNAERFGLASLTTGDEQNHGQTSLAD